MASGGLQGDEEFLMQLGGKNKKESSSHAVSMQAGVFSPGYKEAWFRVPVIRQLADMLLSDHSVHTLLRSVTFFSL